MSTRTGRLAPSRSQLLTIAALVALLVAMAMNTRFLTPAEAEAINPPPFSAETYGKDNFPKVSQMIKEKAVELTVLAPAYVASPAEAGKKYGQDLGSGSYAFPVKATGVADEIDADFITLEVAGLPKGSTVRVPISSAINGNPVRDCTGTIRFGDFPDQSTYQAVATQFGIRIQQDIVAKLDLPSLKGRTLMVTGAWNNGGPPNSYLLQPVSIEAVP